LLVTRTASRATIEHLYSKNKGGRFSLEASDRISLFLLDVCSKVSVNQGNSLNDPK